MKKLIAPLCLLAIALAPAAQAFDLSNLKDLEKVQKAVSIGS